MLQTLQHCKRCHILCLWDNPWNPMETLQMQKRVRGTRSGGYGCFWYWFLDAYSFRLVNRIWNIERGFSRGGTSGPLLLDVAACQELVWLVCIFMTNQASELQVNRFLPIAVTFILTEAFWDQNTCIQTNMCHFRFENNLSSSYLVLTIVLQDCV